MTDETKPTPPGDPKAADDGLPSLDHPSWEHVPVKVRELIKEGKAPVPFCLFCKTPWDGMSVMLAVVGAAIKKDIVPVYQNTMCPHCEEAMKKGFTLVEVDTKPAFEGQKSVSFIEAIDVDNFGQKPRPPETAPYYPTGFWVTLEKTDAMMLLHLTEEQVNRDMKALIPAGHIERMGILRSQAGSHLTLAERPRSARLN